MGQVFSYIWRCIRPVANEEYDALGETVRRIGPYSSIQRILLVGEGDFSFSTSLAKAFGSASNMIATSLNSQGLLTKNYSKFLTNKRELEIRGCIVIHGVDATNMIRHSLLGKLKFDRIIYNFPHTGCFGGSYTDLVKNRKLVRGFVRNAKKMMNEDGEIHITHKSSSLFRLWDLPKIGHDQGLQLIQEIKFERNMYPEYNPKYGFGGDGNFDCYPSSTYKFGLLLYGLGGGTVAHQLLHFWPTLCIHGWELDEVLVDRARQFFGLSELEKANNSSGILKIYVGDALSRMASIEGGYAGIVVDLFSDAKVLQELEKAETWFEMRDKLMPNGRIMVNCGGDVLCDESGWEKNLTIQAMCEAFGKEMVNW
ncbi:hypothetical protein KSS87_011632 [Heliosperma pusillum]|nr:hypothetical protein KSS87_011632 [Heliosperma pusillum]